MVQYAFVHIAESGNLCPRDTRKAVDVIVAATPHSANCHADTIICAHDSCIAGLRDAQSSAGDSGAGDLQKIPPRGFSCRHKSSMEAHENAPTQERVVAARDRSWRTPFAAAQLRKPANSKPRWEVRVLRVTKGIVYQS